MKSPINLTPLPGTILDENHPENLVIPDGVDRKEMFDMYAMQVKSQFTMIVKMYNAQQKMKLSKKRFPFPLKIYFDKVKKLYIIGANNHPDFPNQQIEQTKETAKMFIPFYLLCKLTDEEKWCSIEIPDEEHSIFNFSNGKVYKYGY